MHYFMGRVLIVVEKSGHEARQNLLFSPDVDYDVRVPSRILSRQLKHTMLSVLQDITQDILRDLEKKLRTKTQASWAPCLCTILILCICVEEVQASVHGFALHSNRGKAGDRAMSFEDGIKISQKLDDSLFADCKLLFHNIYKSGKGIFGQENKNERGFNPIRDGCRLDETKGLTQDMCDLADDIHDICTIHGKPF
jgi:hypothetical protein